MSRSSKHFLFCCFLFILFSSPARLEAERIKHVIDGDTVVLENNQRVRLIGVDAPEVDHPKYNRLGEFFGEESRAYLQDRVEGREVSLEDGDEGFDQYGRRLSYIYVDGVLINAELIEKGYAEAMRRFPNKFKEEFLALEEKARAAGSGLWSGQETTREEEGENFPVWLWIAAIVLILRGVYRFFRKGGLSSWLF